MSFQDYVRVVKKIPFLESGQEYSLWYNYKENNDIESRAKLIFHYQPLVLKMARELSYYEKLLPDLVQEGMLALIETVENFEYQKGVAFSLFAMHRIRGRILNFLKKEAKKSLPLENIEGVIVQDFDAKLQKSNAVSKICEMAKRLPIKEQMVFEGVYVDNKNVTEIAKKLTLTTSYVYRLQKKAVQRLRGMLTKIWSDFS